MEEGRGRRGRRAGRGWPARSQGGGGGQRAQLRHVAPVHRALPATAVKVEGMGGDGQVGQQQGGLAQQGEAEGGVQHGGAGQQAQRGIPAQQDRQGARAAAPVVVQVSNVVQKALRQEGREGGKGERRGRAGDRGRG